MSQYSEKDAAKDCNDSTSNVSEAWHEARNDAAESGGHGVPRDRHGSDDSDK